MMWFHLEKIEGVRTTVLPESRVHISGIRLTLDYEEDWLGCWHRLLEFLATALLGMTWIDYFLKNPDLAKVNFFRNEEWKEAQTYLKKI